MAQAVQTRVQEAISSMLQDLDVACVRKMQGDMHRCAARCCDNNSTSMEQVHDCIQSCSTNIISTQNYIQNELSQYQDRIQRCALQCKDDVSDKITSQTSEADAMKYKVQFEDCVSTCGDRFIRLIPSMMVRMKMELEKSLNI